MKIQVCSSYYFQWLAYICGYVYFLVECGIMWSDDKDDETGRKIINILIFRKRCYVAGHTHSSFLMRITVLHL